MTNLLKFIIMFILSIAYISKTEASAYYISPKGNDINIGTITLPFQTIQRGADSARAGDFVYILPGIYYERTIHIRNGGTVSKPITFKAAGGGKSIIDHGLRAGSWIYAGGTLYTTQPIFTAPDTAANNTIQRLIIDDQLYKKVMGGQPVVKGSFSADTATGVITVWPWNGTSPQGRSIVILSERTDDSPGIYIWNDTKNRPVNNIVFDGTVHRGGIVAFWGARFVDNRQPTDVNRNLTVKNCEIGYNWQYAFRLDNWVGATMQNCNVHDSGLVNWPRGDYNITWPHAIIGFNAARVNILDSKIHDNHGEGVGPYLGCSYWVIRNNQVYDNYSINIYVDTDIGNVIVDRNLSYITGKYNTFGPFGRAKLNYPDGIRIANENADLDGATDTTPIVTNVVVTNNVVIGTGDGITSFPYANSAGVIGPSGLARSLIANNTIVNLYTGPDTFKTGIVVARGTNVTVANNISYPQAIRLGQRNAVNIKALNNMVADAVSLDFDPAVVRANTVLGVPGFVGGESYSADSYRLGVASPGINKGLNILSVVSDFAGAGRPQGEQYDIGAFEQ